MRLIGVYGSLKKGFYNHERLHLNRCELVSEGKVFGSLELINGQYPALYEPGSYPQFDAHHTLEIYNVPDIIYEVIEMVEVGAGYLPYKKSIVSNGGSLIDDVTIFYMKEHTPVMTNFITDYSLEVISKRL